MPLLQFYQLTPYLHLFNNIICQIYSKIEVGAPLINVDTNKNCCHNTNVFKLNVSIIGYKGTYYYFMVKGFVVNNMDSTTRYDHERLEKVRRIGF